MSKTKFDLLFQQSNAKFMINNCFLAPQKIKILIIAHGQFTTQKSSLKKPNINLHFILTKKRRWFIIFSFHIKDGDLNSTSLQKDSSLSLDSSINLPYLQNAAKDGDEMSKLFKGFYSKRTSDLDLARHVDICGGSNILVVFQFKLYNNKNNNKAFFFFSFFFPRQNNNNNNKAFSIHSVPPYYPLLCPLNHPLSFYKAPSAFALLLPPLRLAVVFFNICIIHVINHKCYIK